MLEGQSGRIQSYDIQMIVDRVVERLKSGGQSSTAQTRPTSLGLGVVSTRNHGLGIFSTIREAVGAAHEAQKRFAALPLSQRRKIIEAVRELMRKHVEELSILAVEETGLGRIEDKRSKNLL
ncbi:MAG: aldehyde dehydrogenase family protein, partial [Bdellovibrionota bacterium]